MQCAARPAPVTPEKPAARVEVSPGLVRRGGASILARVATTHFDAYLQRARACHTVDAASFVPWFGGGTRLGWIHRERLREALAPPTPFDRGGGGLVIRGTDFAARTAAAAAFVARCVEAGSMPPPTGELYAVAPAVGAPPLLHVDRAAVPWLGVAALGVHVNGYVLGAEGLAVWVGRRAGGKRTFPGHLDNLVAGGCAAGASVGTTLRKEAHEEAGIPPALADRAVRASRLAYAQQDGMSLKLDTLECHDLELPADFVPRPLDGEMESFALWPAAALAASLCGGDRWKPNCALVALDFLLRHRALDAELDADQHARLERAVHGGR
jgi:8-oxo-dGTP pyrophosphatase MutT (NUDIX family)